MHSLSNLRVAARKAIIGQALASTVLSPLVAQPELVLMKLKPPEIKAPAQSFGEIGKFEMEL